MGNKIEHFSDDQGYRHEAEYDAQDKPVADRKYDDKGTLIGEGIYKNGSFVGSKKYFTDDKGFSHEAEFDVSDKPISDKKFDKDGNLVGEGIYKDGKFVGEKKGTLSPQVLQALSRKLVR